METNLPNVTVNLVKGDEQRATAEMLLESVPTLRRLTDEAMATALADLYFRGAEAGAEQATGLIQELGGWLARLVAAHQEKDAQAITAILDKFIDVRCVIKGGPSPTVPN